MPLIDTHSDYIIRMAYAGTVLTYIGKALPGTATSAAGWQLMKLTYDGTNNTQVDFPQDASGNQSNLFAFIWDSRAGYTYAP